MTVLSDDMRGATRRRSIRADAPPRITSMTTNTNPVSAPDAKQNGEYALNALIFSGIGCWLLAGFVYFEMRPNGLPQDRIIYEVIVGILIIAPTIISLSCLSAGQRTHLNAVNKAFETKQVSSDVADLREAVGFVWGAVRHLLPDNEVDDQPRQTRGSQWAHKAADLTDVQLREVAAQVLTWRDGEIVANGTKITTTLLRPMGVETKKGYPEMRDRLNMTAIPTAYQVLVYLWETHGWLTPEKLPGRSFIRYVKLREDLHPPTPPRGSSSLSSGGRRRQTSANEDAQGSVGGGRSIPQQSDEPWDEGKGFVAGVPGADAFSSLQAEMNSAT